MEFGEQQSHFSNAKELYVLLNKCVTKCFDMNKPKRKSDLYYMDLTEKLKYPTIYCHSCLSWILFQEVGTDEVQIKESLKEFRKKQRGGVVIVKRTA